MTRRRRSASRKLLPLVGRYWGVLFGLVLVLALTGREALAVGPVVLCGLAVLVWSLFSAPCVCCAVNRERDRRGEPTYCRNNSSGLLLGCNQVRSHKFQKLSTRLWWFSFLQRRGWRELWSSPSAWIATVSGLLGVAGAVVAATEWIYGQLG